MSDFQQPQQPPPLNPYDTPEMARPGMSSGVKVLLGVGIGCGVLLLLCCGGMGITFFYFGRSFQNAVSEDPATIRRITDDIVVIDVPESLEPKFSFDWTIPLVNQSILAAGYVGEGEQSIVILFQIDEGLGDPAEMKRQFEEAMRNADTGEFNEVEIEDPQKFETEINGEAAEFQYGKGKQDRTDREVWQAIGVFAGRGGPAMLLMQLDAEAFDEEQALAILRSMK